MRINEFLKGMVSFKDLLTGKKPRDIKNSASRASEHAELAYAGAVRRLLTHDRAQARRMNSRGLPVGLSRHHLVMTERAVRNIERFPTKLVPDGKGTHILVPKSNLRRQIMEDTVSRCQESVKARAKMSRRSKTARRVMNAVHA